MSHVYLIPFTMKLVTPISLPFFSHQPIHTIPRHSPVSLHSVVSSDDTAEHAAQAILVPRAAGTDPPARHFHRLRLQLDNVHQHPHSCDPSSARQV